LYFCVQYPIKLGMRNNTIVPVATFRALFTELIPCRFLYTLLRRCGVRRRCPPVVSAWELIQGLIFHVVAEAGTLAQHVKQLTGKTITDGALAQRRARLPIAVFEQMMDATLQPKGEPTRHPEAFYQGLRLCGVDGSLFSVTNTPVRGEFVIERPLSGDPAPLPPSPMPRKLLAHEKCDCIAGAPAGRTGHSPGNWRNPGRSR
jgi:hypothetical protein